MADWRENSQFDVTVQGEKRDTARAVLGSAFFPGLGQLYCGKGGRALAVFLIPWALVTLLFILWANTSEHLDVDFILVIATLATGYIIWVIYDAYKIVGDVSGEFVPESYNKPVFYVLFAVMTVVLTGFSSFVFSRYYVRTYRVFSAAMAPTLLPGDVVLANHAVYRHRDPVSGDVAVVRFPGEEGRVFMRRVVGVPGDRILVTVTGDLYINGKKEKSKAVTKPYPMWLPDGTKEEVRQYYTSIGERFYRILKGRVDPTKSRKLKGEVKVPQGSYFVLSDFRTRGYDSRQVGFIPREDFVALVGSIYLSTDLREGVRFERMGERVQ